MDQLRELGTFLKTRRARVRPAEVGLATHGHRRVPGLRREELAQLAGVSADYYLRLEQGRGGNPSEGVLDALAAALRLDDAERAHLYDLARPTRPRRQLAQPERLRPELQLLLDAMDQVPAYVVGRCMDVLAWNRLAAALVADFGSLPPAQRNTAKLVFLDPHARTQYPDWELGAQQTVAHLRLLAGRYPGDPGIAALIEELSASSEDFRTWWARHDVQEKTHGQKDVLHPTAGKLTLYFETLELRGEPGQMLITYVAEPGSESAAALARL